MPRDISDALRLLAVTAHSDVPVFWLLEVETPESPPRRYRLVNNTEPVSFGVDSAGDPLVYSPAGFLIRPIAETRESEQTVLQVVMSAAGNELSHRVDEWDGLDDAPVVLRLVSQLDLGDPAASVPFEGRIVGAGMTMISSEEGTFPGLAFEVANGNLYEQTLPKRRMGKTRCGVQFGGSECGYVVPASPTNTTGGGFDFCPRAFGDCVQRGNDEFLRGLPRQHPKRWDAFLGIPRQGVGPL